MSAETLSDGTTITAIIDGEKTIITTLGVADSIAEVGQQFAWIGAALRSVPIDCGPGLYKCSPQLVSVTGKTDGNDEGKLVCEFDFSMESPIEITGVPGGCWHNMLKNPVLVTGFPIRAKSAQNSGVEMPLDIMACLAGSHRAIEFDGKMILKGFSTMLTAVKQIDDLLLWHYTFHIDKSRISFLEAAAPSGAHIHLGLLATSRHAVGWCSSARCHTGKRKPANRSCPRLFSYRGSHSLD